MSVTAEITWRRIIPMEITRLADDVAWAGDNGYTVFTWSDVNKAGSPVILTRVMTGEAGITVALYETRHDDAP